MRALLLLAGLAMAFLACVRHPPSPVPTQNAEATAAPALEVPPRSVATQDPSPAPTARPSVTPTVATPLVTLPSATVPASVSTPGPPELTQIMLVVELDYARHHLAITETITYTNRTAEPLTELLLVAEPNRWPGALRINALRRGDDVVEGYRLEAGKLALPLSAPLLPDESVSLALLYGLDVPPHLGPLGYSERQLNLGDWYLFPPPYHPDRGWLIHEPAGVGEHLVYDLYDFRLDLKLVGSETDLVVAASAPAQVGDVWRHYRLTRARSFALSVSPVYDCLRGPARDIVVEACVFPEHRTPGAAALKATTGALLLYSELFGPYPHASLTLVEAGFPDGMEYDGLFFLGQEYFAAYDGTPRNYLTMLAAHETAHQWWYGIAGNDQALEPWLDEAWATYSELLFYEAQYPDAVVWWWDYRVNRFRPTGWVNSTIYDHRSFRSYVNAVYLRGALFLHRLRNALGDEAFLDVAGELLASDDRPVLSAQDFFATVARHTGQDNSLAYEEFFHLNR